MNLLFGAPAINASESFTSGNFSRIIRFGNQQLHMLISFTPAGIIRFLPSDFLAEVGSPVLKYKSYGQVIRIHEQGGRNTLAYYSYFFDDNRLHLCALNDENEIRKSVMNGAWRIEKSSIPLNRAI